MTSTANPQSQERWRRPWKIQGGIATVDYNHRREERLAFIERMEREGLIDGDGTAGRVWTGNGEQP